MPYWKPLKREPNRQPRTDEAGTPLCDHCPGKMVGRYVNTWGPSFLCTRHYGETQKRWRTKHPE